MLVTGGMGFIGSHLIRELLIKGAEITSIDKNDQSRILNPKELKSIANFNGELKDREFIHRIIYDIKPDFVFHLAANILRDRNIENCSSLIEENIISTTNLFLETASVQSKKFVFLSTAELYKAELNKKITEESPIKIKSLYSASKYSAEVFLHFLSQKTQIPLQILRISNVFGEGQSESMFVPQLIKSCLRNQTFEMTFGEQKRDYIYVQDVIHAIIASTNNNLHKFEILNLASGNSIKIRDLAKLIHDLVGSNSEIKFGAIPYRTDEDWEFSFDINNASKLLNFKPNYSLNNVLKKTICWYQ